MNMTGMPGGASARDPRDPRALLDCKQLAPEALVEHVRGAIGLGPGDVLLLCGSLAEGLGNADSDIDLLLLTERGDLAAAPTGDVMLCLDGKLLDVRIVPLADMHALAAQLAGWADNSQDDRAAKGIGEESRKLLHRAKHGLPLHGGAQFAPIEQAIGGDALARHLLSLSRYLISTFQVDMAGFHRAHDAISLHFAGQQLLGHLMDAVLASQGFTTGNPKWRSRQLAGLAPHWEAGLYGVPCGQPLQDVFLGLSAFDPHGAVTALVERALRIVALARRVLPMLGVVRPSLVTLVQPDGIGPDDDRSPTMPHLDLDVAVRYRQGYFELFRLNKDGGIFRLGSREYAIVCLCDGLTTFDQACGHAGALWGESGAQALVEQVLALIQFGNLEAPAYVDDQVLARLLEV